MSIFRIDKDDKTLIKAFIAFMVIGFIILLWLKSFTNSIFDSTSGGNFFISLCASFVEDILFFGVIGVVLYLLSKANPADRSFRDKIKFLANAENIKDESEAIKYLEQSIKASLVYSSETTVTMKFIKYYPDFDVVEVFTEVNRTLRNMRKDEDSNTIPFRSSVESDLRVGDNYGYISHLSIVDPNKKDEIINAIDAQPIFMESNKYVNDIDFIISKNSKALWRFCYSMFNKVGYENKLVNTVGLFTENYKLVIKNEMIGKEPITLNFNYPDKKRGIPVVGSVTINYNATSTICPGVIFHADDLCELIIIKPIV